ncbi:unnamed protein product, partial [Staurois parvus]
MEEFSEGHKDMMEPPNTRNPPERCPRPLYSRDSTQEDHTIPHHDKVEVTKKMMELLTGEVRGARNIEGHKDLYKDVMMDNQPPLTSPDGSSHGNPPERCPRPLYSRNSTQEDHTIPHHHQSGNLGDYIIVVKEEYKEEDEEYGVIKEYSEEHKDMME